MLSALLALWEENLLVSSFEERFHTMVSWSAFHILMNLFAWNVLHFTFKVNVCKKYRSYIYTHVWVLQIDWQKVTCICMGKCKPCQFRFHILILWQEIKMVRWSNSICLCHIFNGLSKSPLGTLMMTCIHKTRVNMYPLNVYYRGLLSNGTDTAYHM